MSTRTAPRRAHLSVSTPREGENLVEVLSQVGLVGKQTTISIRNTLEAPSFLAEWLPRFVLFHPAGLLPCPPRQAVHLALLRSPGQTGSAVLRLPKSSRQTATDKFAHKLFGLHELPSGVRRRGLTRGGPERYTAIHRGRSRRGGLSKSPNGPIARLSPEIVESAV